LSIADILRTSERGFSKCGHACFLYKHTEPDFWQKIKHMLSITPSLNLRCELNFIFEFNQSTSLEVYAFVNETKAIFTL